MRCKLLIFNLLIALLYVSVAQAQFTITHTASVCTDPTDLSIVVGSENDKEQYHECKKWSQFSGATEIFESNQFMKGYKNVYPVNRFAKAVIRLWTGVENSLPHTSLRLYDNPGRFGLIEVGPDESRHRSLVVWKARSGGHGMIAYVINEEKEEKGAEPLAKYQVLYPSDKRDELRITDVATLTDSRGGKEKFLIKFLRRKHVRLYWNHWIESGHAVNKKSQKLYAKTPFLYHIDLSAIDFDEFLANRESPRIVFNEEEATILLPKQAAFERFNVTVFPLGKFRDTKAITRAFMIDNRRLRNTLTTNKSLEWKNNLNAISELHGAMFNVVNEVQAPDPGLNFRFIPETEGDAALAVLIWKNGAIIDSWIQLIKIFPDSKTKSAPISDECGYPPPVTQLYDTFFMPRFDPQRHGAVAARLTFVDFRDPSDSIESPTLTMGFFEDLRKDAGETCAWILKPSHGLRKELAIVEGTVNARIEDRIYDPVDQSDNLKDILFSCKVEDKTDRQSLTQDQRDEYQCPGEKAYKMLTEIARGARNARPEPKSLKTEADSGKDVRIQVTYRDTNNSIYYIPIHLLRVEKGKDDLLADAVRIEQPLPIMFRTSTEERCVSQWVAGLVLKEPYYDEKGWRNNWLHKFGEMKNYSFWPIVNMQDLRNTYFLNRPGIPKNIRSGMPEGLVLLSHYGEGYITDQENFYSSNRVGPDDVQRVFGGFSLAVIAACSVGGLGGPDRENTLFIHKLNENNVRAAIISPFKIPPPAATRFLDALRTIMSNLTTSRSLYDVFMDTRAEYRKANTAEGHLIPWVNLFMLIGDGDVKICKSNK